MNDDFRNVLPEPTVVKSEKVDFNWLCCEACGGKIVHLLVSNPRPDVLEEDPRPGFPVTIRRHKSSSEISYRAECPFCGDRSRSTAVVGAVCPVPAPGVGIVDVEMDGDRAFIRTVK